MTQAATALPQGRASALNGARLGPLALGAALIPVLAANGGYFPTAWGWTAVGLAWAAVIAGTLRASRRPAMLETVQLAGFAGLTLWLCVSLFWTAAPTQTPLEIERLLVYVAAALALFTVVQREHIRLLLGAVCAAMFVICGYALATRLFPDRIGVFDPIAGYRLSTPIGYWNGLALVAAMGALLALIFVARAATAVGRAAAGAAIPVLMTTLYFTYSRGGWIAFIAGLVVLVAADTNRLQFLASAAPIAAVGAVVVFLASRESALTHQSAVVATAVHQGQRLAAVIVAACAAAALAGVAARTVQRRRTMPKEVTAAAPWVTVVVAVAAATILFAHFGSPIAIARHGYRAFTAPPPSIGSNLNGRLFNLSGSGRWTQWVVAAHAFETRPFTGIGAGAYEWYWLEHRAYQGKIRDAHSLYLETLAETGIVGLALLSAALIAPLAAVRRARQDPLAAGALAAYVAYLVHAGVDWDWELTGVTLAALMCGGALLAAARGTEQRSSRLLPIALASTVAVAALGGLIGNLKLSQNAKAARAGNWSNAAAEARRAATWAPWSAEPWQRLGEAQLAQGDAAAKLSFGKAISKDRNDWNLWFDLARATDGTMQKQALAQAARLNPLSPEIAEFRRELGAGATVRTP